MFNLLSLWHKNLKKRTSGRDLYRKNIQAIYWSGRHRFKEAASDLMAILEAERTNGFQTCDCSTHFAPKISGRAIHPVFRQTLDQFYEAAGELMWSSIIPRLSAPDILAAIGIPCISIPGADYLSDWWISQPGHLPNQKFRQAIESLGLFGDRSSRAVKHLMRSMISEKKPCIYPDVKADSPFPWIGQWLIIYPISKTLFQK